MWVVAGLAPGCFAPTGSGTTGGAGTDTTGGAATTELVSTGGVTGSGVVETTGDPSATAGSATTTEPTASGGTTMSLTSGGTSTGDGSSSGTTDSIGTCGDGLLQDGEECDMGMENGNNKVCTAGCKMNICGDGLPCKMCGHECDDGNQAADDGCSAACTWEERVVFVTQKLWTGKELGGVTGADQKCNVAAEAIDELSGRKFVAWLSKDVVDPASKRIGVSLLPYVRRDKVKVADGSKQFSSGTILAPINVNEAGDPLTANDCLSGINRVWTGTESTGFASVETCSVWSMNGMTGKVGNLSSTGAEWTACMMSASCDSQGRLYCVQVAG